MRARCGQLHVGLAVIGWHEAVVRGLRDGLVLIRSWGSVCARGFQFVFRLAVLNPPDGGETGAKVDKRLATKRGTRHALGNPFEGTADSSIFPYRCHCIGYSPEETRQT